MYYSLMYIQSLTAILLFEMFPDLRNNLKGQTIDKVVIISLSMFHKLYYLLVSASLSCGSLLYA
jgi:hypothetical protein